MNNGYTTTITHEEKRANELASLLQILAANPDNAYWQNRLAAWRDNEDDDYMDALREQVERCDTDPAHILNAQKENDWLQSENAAGLYGDAVIGRLNKAAGYDLFGAMATVSEARKQWESEYLAKRKANYDKYWRKAL